MLEAFFRQLSIDYLIRKKYVLHRVLVLLVLEFYPHEENIQHVHPAYSDHIKENPVKANASTVACPLVSGSSPADKLTHLRGHLFSQARNGNDVARIPVKFSDATSL
jgi:hypothetical protein